MLLFEWASRIETVGFKLAEGKGLWAGRDSKELWKTVEKVSAQAMPLGAPWSKRISISGGLEVQGYARQNPVRP